jgi:hypothetical protein
VEVVEEHLKQAEQAQQKQAETERLLQFQALL